MRIVSKRSRYVFNPIEEEDRLAERLMKAGKKIIKLNRGDPAVYFRTPQYILDAYKDALQSGKTSYGNPVGVPELRKAVAERYRGLYGLRSDSEHIIITQGISEGLLMLNATLINEGDKAVLFKPYYPIYVPYLKMFGGKLILERYDENREWNVDTESLERSLRKERRLKRTRYLLITNPNNPTGTVLSRSVLNEIVDLANEHNLLLISDEIYDELIFNKARFTSICQVADGIPYVILNGASKNFDSPGFRIGFVIMPNDDKISRAVRERLENFAVTRLSANIPAQYAMAEALNNRREHMRSLRQIVREMEKRVNFTTRLVNESDYMHAVLPHGAFYIFPRVSFDQLQIKNDAKFVEKLLLEEGVQITRGSGFGDPDHVRLVSLATEDVLELAVDRINRFCRRHAK